jgi:outer membrane protein
MILKKSIQKLFFSVLAVCIFVVPQIALSDNTPKILNLPQIIKEAIAVNTLVKSSGQETLAAGYAKKAQRTAFLPTFTASYEYKRNDEQQSDPVFGITRLEEEYDFVATVTQPVFTGFSLINEYKLAKLNLDFAKILEKQARLNLIFETKEAYFSLLKTQKFLAISLETVTQIKAQKNVAKNFFESGMSPYNELLEAEVELANAVHDVIAEKNNFRIALANLKRLLRRSENEDVRIADVLEYEPLAYNSEYCFDMAEKKRPEIKIADLKIKIARQELKLSQKDFYPQISLTGNYYQRGTEYDIKGGDGISDIYLWDVTATASWDLWAWGRTYYSSREKQSRVKASQYQSEDIKDKIRFEVKEAFLRTIESEKYILTVKKAIEQAEENFRINKERYKEQVATSTDVLNAQTLLSKTKTNYFNALYGFHLSKARLDKAMGQEIIQ